MPAKILKKFGKKRQWLKLSEEMIELLKSIIAYECRYESDTSNIIEEIADVEIMLDQMKRAYKIKCKDIKRIKKFKIKRTHRRYNL